jgi:heat shock protein HslJ
MTDEQMDARLRRAGDAWRAADEADASTRTLDREPLPLVPPANRTWRRRHTGLLASAAVVAAALVAGAGLLIANAGSDRGPSKVEAGPITLARTSWTLVGATTGDGLDVPVAGTATLVIDGANHLSGNDGCNSISGDVRVTGATIDFGNGLATTAIGCLDQQVGASSGHVDMVLSGSVTWSIRGDELTLTSPKQGTLVYRAVAADVRSTDPNNLIGITWHLTTVETGTGPDGTAQSVTGAPTLQVGRQPGQIAASDGCDLGNADATVGTGTLKLDNAVWTTKQCGGTGQATAIRAVLSGDVSWVIDNDQLTLTKPGVGALVYQHDTATPTLDRTWKLTQIATESAAGGSGEGSSDYGVTLTFTAGGFRLDAGCGAYAGNVQVGATELVFSGTHALEPGRTCLAAPPAGRVVQLLDGAVTWSISKGELNLARQGTTLTFAPPQQSGSSLVGPTWTLFNIDSEKSSSSNSVGTSGLTKVTVHFDGTGSVTISHRCYIDSGSAQLGDATISISNVTLKSAIPCPSTRNQADEQHIDAMVDEVLSGTSTWTISGGVLLVTKAGTTLYLG